MLKKKMPFIQLTIFFSIVILLTLFYEWGSNSSSKASMMDQSMGNMMTHMHLSEITVRDLIVQEDQQQDTTQSSIQTGSGHHNSEGFLKQLHVVTTKTIVILLPFIIAGTIFLAIIWFDTSKEAGT